MNKQVHLKPEQLFAKQSWTSQYEQTNLSKSQQTKQANLGESSEPTNRCKRKQTNKLWATISKQIRTNKSEKEFWANKCITTPKARSRKQKHNKTFERACAPCEDFRLQLQLPDQNMRLRNNMIAQTLMHWFNAPPESHDRSVRKSLRADNS